MVGCIHYQSSYRTHSDSQLIKKFLLGWCASCYIASTYIVTALFRLLFESLQWLLDSFHVSHNFKIIAHFRLQVNHFLIIIFVESSLGWPIFKTLGYLDHLDNVLVFGRVVDLLLKKLVSHLLLGCAKRESVAHDWITGSKVMVARVAGVALHLKGDIQEV